MKKNTLRLISFILTVLMVLSVFPPLAFAQPSEEPIVITKQPVTHAWGADSNTTFSVEAQGTGELTYAWYYIYGGKESTAQYQLGGTSFKGWDTPTLSLTYCGAWTINRDFFCVISDNYGHSVTTDKVQVTKPTLTVTKQPENTWWESTSPYGGSFSVEVQGTGNLTYKWYRVNTHGDVSEVSVAIGGTHFEGMDTPTLTFTGGGNWIAGYSFYCVITDKWGTSVTSDKAQIAKPSITITKQPETHAWGGDSNSTFSVEVKGTGALTYEWHYISYGVDYPASNGPIGGTHFSGYDTPTLALEYCGPWTLGRDFYCIISDTFGNTVTSEKAQIKMPSLDITKQPETHAWGADTNTTFTVEVEGTGQLTYEWHYISYSVDHPVSNGPIGGTHFSGYDTPTLALEYCGPWTVGHDFYCIITDRWGNKVTTDMVQVKKPTLTITKQPITHSWGGDTNTTFTVEAQGTGDLTYEWYYISYGADHPASYGPVGGTHFSDYDTPTLALEYCGAWTLGIDFYCIVSDRWGNKVTSEKVQVTKPTLSVKKQPVDVEWDLDSPRGGSFTVEMNGTGELTYEWYYVSTSGGVSRVSVAIGGTHFEGFNTATLTFTGGGTWVENYKFYCIVKDKWGNSVKTGEAKLKAPGPRIDAQPQATEPDKDWNASFTVEATGRSELTYSWWCRAPFGVAKKVTGSIGATTVASGTDTATLRLSDIGSDLHNYTFYCIVTDKYNASVYSMTALLTVPADPEVTVHPEDTSWDSNLDASFTVEATGKNLTYEWHSVRGSTDRVVLSPLGGSTITGINSPTLKIASCGVWVTGIRFYCVVTDMYGRTASSDEAVILASEHTYIRHSAKAATCTEAGWEAYSTCEHCGFTNYKEIEPLGHDFDQSIKANVTRTEPTCTADGNFTVRCSRCTEKQVNVLTKTGHKWNSGAITTPATCTAEGVKTFTCTACSATRTETVSKIAHSEVTDSAVPATCTEAGLTQGKHCSVCKAILVEQTVIDAKGHTIVTDAKKAPTCTETGLTEGKHCSVCNAVTVLQTVIPAKGHSWDEGKITKPSTETEEGVKTSTCPTCGATKTEAIPKLEKTEPDYIMGDVDGDEKITVADARLALRGAINLTGDKDVNGVAINLKDSTSRAFLAANADKEGSVTVGDARLILRAAIGLETLK